MQTVTDARARGRRLLAAGAGVVSLALLGRALARDLRRERDASRFVESREVPVAAADANTLIIHTMRTAPHARPAPRAVLVHGYGVSSAYFTPLAARLAHAFEVHAPDLPGHGRTEGTVPPASVEQQAGILARWMDASGLSGAVLIGHSLGCQIVAETAAARPGLARAVVLIGPTMDPRSKSIARLAGRTLVTALHERPGLLLRVVRDYARAGLRTVTAEMRHMLAHRPEPALSALRCPVLVIRGGRDLIVGRRWFARVARITSGRALTLGHFGHAVQYSDPDAVARAIAAFMRGNRVYDDGTHETAARTTPHHS